MKNQSGTIKTNLELDRHTLHHNIYIIINFFITIIIIILDNVHNQQKTKGGWRSGLAREEEAWLKKKEKFDKMMAEEKEKVTRRKLIKALVDVEEEMDSIKKQIFGGQLKPDLERKSLNWVQKKMRT